MTQTHVAPADVAPTVPLPRIYLACALTNLCEARRGTVGLTLALVRATIEAVTFEDHTAGEQWPVAVYAPYDNSAPWSKDGLSASGVYERNLSELLDSDALVVVADKAGSAGVGQEIEWATRAGLPILYLATDSASRQIAGTPAHITCVTHRDDAETLRAQLGNWLRQTRHRIEAGPLRRDNRALRYSSLTSRLQKAWRESPDPTGTAARCSLHPTFIESVLSHPARVALLAADTLSLLCAELGVRPPGATGQLGIRATRAWLLAAQEAAWDDRTAERMRMVSLAAQQQNRDVDLDTPAAWLELHGVYM